MLYAFFLWTSKRTFEAAGSAAHRVFARRMVARTLKGDGLQAHFLSVYFFSVFLRSTPVVHGSPQCLPIFGGGNATMHRQPNNKAHMAMPNTTTCCTKVIVVVFFAPHIRSGTELWCVFFCATCDAWGAFAFERPRKPLGQKTHVFFLPPPDSTNGPIFF